MKLEYDKKTVYCDMCKNDRLNCKCLYGPYKWTTVQLKLEDERR